MMRSLTFLALACALASPAQAANPACDQKADEIQRQIEQVYSGEEFRIETPDSETGKSRIPKNVDQSHHSD